MKKELTLVISSIAILSAISGCKQHPENNGVKIHQSKNDSLLWMDAESVALGECTNQISGISKIIDIFPITAGPVEKWKCLVTLDYINAAGGIQRTNLDFKYKIQNYGYGDELHIGHEYEEQKRAAIAEKEQAEFEARVR